ncbi:hypothetical protein GGR55DRAFT_127367 [Xylaria sp. FL0064]|nr:hypothetical protein GGR55DRAFT_127367 [Xylaria sp. FL0064]
MTRYSIVLAPFPAQCEIATLRVPLEGSPYDSDMMVAVGQRVCLLRFKERTVPGVFKARERQEKGKRKARERQEKGKRKARERQEKGKRKARERQEKGKTKARGKANARRSATPSARQATLVLCTKQTEKVRTHPSSEDYSAFQLRCWQGSAHSGTAFGCRGFER